jgi:MraZ protein
VIRLKGLKGKALATTDVKGRVSLPAKYRKLLPGDLVLTKSPDNAFPALVLYTPDGFEEWMDEVLASKGGYHANDKSHDDIIAKYYEYAEDVKVDGAGRILIPAELRDYAHLEKDVVFTGARDHLIVRSHAIWTKYQTHLDTVSAHDTPCTSDTPSAHA